MLATVEKILKELEKKEDELKFLARMTVFPGPVPYRNHPEDQQNESLRP